MPKLLEEFNKINVNTELSNTVESNEGNPQTTMRNNLVEAAKGCGFKFTQEDNFGELKNTLYICKAHIKKFEELGSKLEQNEIADKKYKNQVKHARKELVKLLKKTKLYEQGLITSDKKYVQEFKAMLEALEEKAPILFQSLENDKDKDKTPMRAVVVANGPCMIIGATENEDRRITYEDLKDEIKKNNTIVVYFVVKSAAKELSNMLRRRATQNELNDFLNKVGGNALSGDAAINEIDRLKRQQLDNLKASTSPDTIEPKQKNDDKKNEIQGLTDAINKKIEELKLKYDNFNNDKRDYGEKTTEYKVLEREIIDMKKELMKLNGELVLDQGPLSENIMSEAKEYLSMAQVKYDQLYNGCDVDKIMEYVELQAKCELIQEEAKQRGFSAQVYEESVQPPEAITIPPSPNPVNIEPIASNSNPSPVSQVQPQVAQAQPSIGELNTSYSISNALAELDGKHSSDFANLEQQQTAALQDTTPQQGLPRSHSFSGAVPTKRSSVHVKATDIVTRGHSNSQSSLQNLGQNGKGRPRND